jgi:hypothetical protein
MEAKGVQGTDLIDTIVESESAKSLNRPGMAKLLAMVDKGKSAGHHCGQIGPFDAQREGSV